MKRVISVILMFVMLGSMCLTGCGSSGGDLKMWNSYMRDDNTVVVTFKNETNKTITNVRGTIYLYTGSATSQNAIKSPSFTWSGSCAKGDTFTVTVNVSGAPRGLASQVNRICHSIWEIS